MRLKFREIIINWSSFLAVERGEDDDPAGFIADREVVSAGVKLDKRDDILFHDLLIWSLVAENLGKLILSGLAGCNFFHILFLLFKKLI